MRDAQSFCFFADTHARTPNSESNLHSFAIPLRAPPPPLPPPPHSPLCDLLLQRIKSLFCTKTDEAPAHVHNAATEHFPFCPFGLDFTCRCTLEELRSRLATADFSRSSFFHIRLRYCWSVNDKYAACFYIFFTASGWAASRGRLAKVRERELNVPSMADGTFPVSLGFISHFHLRERFEIGPFRILEKKNTLNKQNRRLDKPDCCIQSRKKEEDFKAALCFCLKGKMSPSADEI